jgi:hypothetical protein
MNKRHENILAVQRCCGRLHMFYSRSASAELHMSLVAGQLHLCRISKNSLEATFFCYLRQVTPLPVRTSSPASHGFARDLIFL